MEEREVSHHSGLRWYTIITQHEWLLSWQWKKTHKVYRQGNNKIIFILSLYYTLSPTNTNIHTHIRTHTHAHTHTHIQTHTKNTYALKHTHTLTHDLFHFFYFYLSFIHTQTHTYTHHTHMHTRTHTLPLYTILKYYWIQGALIMHLSLPPSLPLSLLSLTLWNIKMEKSWLWIFFSTEMVFVAMERSDLLSQVLDLTTIFLKNKQKLFSNKIIANIWHLFLIVFAFSLIFNIMTVFCIEEIRDKWKQYFFW